MRAPDDSGIRVSLALRGAHIAKLALELMSLNPELAHLQLVEVVKAVKETDEWLQSKGFGR
jgi:hypothetical protein